LHENQHRVEVGHLCNSKRRFHQFLEGTAFAQRRAPNQPRFLLWHRTLQGSASETILQPLPMLDFNYEPRPCPLMQCVWHFPEVITELLLCRKVGTSCDAWL
jgi:hypothetical protein